jgi:hypothetical protein
VLPVALDYGWEILAGELLVWGRRAGIDEPVPDWVAEPCARLLAGDCEGSADLLRRMGRSYEAALALADSDDPDSLRRALDELRALDAAPAAELVARRRYRNGASAVPVARGARRARTRPV